MLYRAALLIALPAVAAQSCATTGAGTLACTCYMASCLDVTSMGASIQVTTTLGPIIGRTNGGVNRFAGVPTGASTGGANRWQAPKTTSWTAALQTTTERMCTQQGYPLMGSEDCITIDIFAPATAGTGSGYPISLYVHGGGFTRQDPSFAMLASGMNQPTYNFANLPNTGKNIAIMAHYRMGPLGWMAHPGFAGSTIAGFPGTNPGSGNYGMMDILHHLAWVQQNIAAFGGDAQKVNVYGESAGAALITVMIASPLVVGLAKSFICESPYISFSGSTFSLGARQEMNTLFTMRAGCSTTTAIPAVGSADAITEAACLRAATPSNLMVDGGFNGPNGGGPQASVTARSTFEAAYGANTAAIFLYNAVYSWPVVDGYVITMPPLEAYASGINAQASIIIGQNADEYTTFCYYPFIDATSYYCGQAPNMMDHAYIIGLHYLDVSTTLAEYFAAVQGAFNGPKMTALRAGLFYNDLVGPVSGNQQNRAVQMANDAWFAQGIEAVTEALLVAPGRPSGSVYHYIFAHDSHQALLPYAHMGACHGCDLTYVLGFYTASVTYLSLLSPPSTNLHTIVPDADDNKVGNAMNRYWASMWHTNSPNTVGSGLPHWTPVSATDRQTMVFQGQFTLGAEMNPCVRFAACRTENTKDWRKTRKLFWNSAPASLSYTGCSEPVCTSAPVGTYSHFMASSIGFNCTYLPCCVYGSSAGRRKLLFGAPSSGVATGNCDPMC